VRGAGVGGGGGGGGIRWLHQFGGEELALDFKEALSNLACLGTSWVELFKKLTDEGRMVPGTNEYTARVGCVGEEAVVQ